MEQNLNTTQNDEFEIKNFFQIEYKGQNVTNSLEFKKWYDSAINYIKNENKRRKEAYIRDGYIRESRILTIQFCENCLIYTLCSLGTLFSYIKYNNCNEEFCIGCSKKRLKYGDGDGDDSICLKGYIKAFYLRIIYRRSGLVITSPVFHVMHIIFCLFFTPLFIGFISNFMGFIVHRKNRDFIAKDDLSKAIKI